MQGVGELSDDTQIVICESKSVHEVVSEILAAQMVVLWEPAKDEDHLPETFAFLGNRDVIIFCDDDILLKPLMRLVTQANPAKVRYTDKPVPTNFTSSWAVENIRPWVPNGQSAQQESSEVAGSPPCESGPAGADPSQDDLNSILGDDPDEPIPEGHPAAITPPAGDYEQPERSSVWVRPEAEEWPLPHDPFEFAKPPSEFDTAVFAGDLAFLDAFCSDLSELKGTDYGIAAISAIVSLSAWVHETWQLQVKERDDTWREAARVWGLVVGSSSDGKSVGLNLATKPARDLDSLAAKDAAVKLAKYASDKRIFDQRLADYEKRAGRDELKPNERMPEPPDAIEVDRRLFKEGNIEGFRGLLETTPKGWLYTDEMSAFVASMGKYSVSKDAALGERSQWIQAWDGGAHTILRASKPIHIESWSCSILGGVTPSSLFSSLGSGKLQGDGFIQRFLIINTRHQRNDCDKEQDTEALAAMRRTLSGLRRMRPDRDLPLKLSPDAYQYFRKFIDRVQGMAGNAVYSGSCQSHLLKLRSQAVRIALTLHLAQRANREQDCAAGEYVPLETMKMAVGICEQLIPHITYFWSGVIGAEDRILDKELQKICELIACFHMESPTFGIAKIASSYRDWWPKKSGAQKAHLLAALQDMNWIRPNPKGTMQSPGVLTSYMLHPALRRMFDRHPHIIQERARRRAVVAHFAEPSPDSENPEVS